MWSITLAFRMVGMAEQGKPKGHEDTTVKLDMSFEEAIRRLTTQKDSEAAESGKTKAPDPESGASKPKTSRRPKSS